MSMELRLAAAVLAASDRLSRQLVSVDAMSVTDHPAKGSKAGHFVIEVGIDGDDEVMTINLPHSMADNFAAKINEMSDGVGKVVERNFGVGGVG